MFGAASAAQAGSGSHTPWSSIKHEYINPEDWKLWKASMSSEDWDRWQKSINPEQWEAWQASGQQSSKSAVVDTAVPVNYQEAGIQSSDAWQ
jgi:hypothetical protein